MLLQLLWQAVQLGKGLRLSSGSNQAFIIAYLSPIREEGNLGLGVNPDHLLAGQDGDAALGPVPVLNPENLDRVCFDLFGKPARPYPIIRF